jgi:hypothetical protein
MKGGAQLSSRISQLTISSTSSSAAATAAPSEVGRSARIASDPGSLVA